MVRKEETRSIKAASEQEETLVAKDASSEQEDSALDDGNLFAELCSDLDSSDLI